ncbi:MAG: hypothetical protein AVDCRST_MAG68-1742, partial [uncultured Gemmatimonadetes bacterium]
GRQISRISSARSWGSPRRGCYAPRDPQRRWTGPGRPASTPPRGGL